LFSTNMMSRMLGKILRLTLVVGLPLLTTACGQSYSPDTYSSSAVQQANKVDQAVVVGIRSVAISADPTLGTATGGAAGGIAGSQVGSGAVQAFGALGGTLAGGLVGNAVAHSAGDTNGYEYIVRKPNNDLLSVTQKDETPLSIGEHVLIIAGPQARIVRDYTVPLPDDHHDAVKTAEAPPFPTGAASTAVIRTPSPPVPAPPDASEKPSDGAEQPGQVLPPATENAASAN
jgi:outer membrane lipoprotein SlyB